MKNFKILFSVAVASAFVGCSSMAVDDVEAVEGFVPADFNTQEYLELHPELLRLQIQDYIRNLNNRDTVAYKALGAEAYKAYTTDSIPADKKAFEDDTATVHYILRTYAAVPDEMWEQSLVPTAVHDTTYKMDTISVGVKKISDDSTANFTAVYICDKDAITKSTENDSLIAKVVGYESVVIDSSVCLRNDKNGKCTKFKYSVTCGGESATYGSDEYSFNTKVTKGKDAGLRIIESDVVASVKDSIVPGSVSKKLLEKAELYNYNGSRDDLAILQAFELDTFAISSQYAVFAQEHGWAYRRCKPTDNLGQFLRYTITEPLIGEDGQPMVDADGNALTSSRDTVTAVYPMTKLYCDDNGQARELN